jgi:hypothetical protein
MSQINLGFTLFCNPNDDHLSPPFLMFSYDFLFIIFVSISKNKQMNLHKYHEKGTCIHVGGKGKK